VRWLAVLIAVLIALGGCATYQSTYRRARVDDRGRYSAA